MIAVSRVWSRRAVLAQFGCAARMLAQTADPLSTLRPDHPRLMVLDSDLDRIRALTKEGNPLHKLYLDQTKEAEKLLITPPVEYKLANFSLLPQSQRTVDRIYLLATLYRLDKKTAYLERAIKELQAAVALKDWNPSHILDTAEMAHAVAIGYDWLYEALSAELKEGIRSALRDKALVPALQAYQSQSSWARNGGYGNLVANSAFGLTALALVEDTQDQAAAVLRFAVASISHGLDSYGSDGAWTDRPGYWDYATRYTVCFLASLQSALNSDLGIPVHTGFPRTGRYRLQSTGPTLKVFNFGDSREDAPEDPALFWLSRRFSQPSVAWLQQKFMDRALHPDTLNLPWYVRDAKSPQTVDLPLDAVYSSIQCAYFRGSWDDPNGLFLAVKGGDNKNLHSHLDLGSFVLDAGGIRWARDLGPEDAPTTDSQGKQRWTYYRTRTESHNTLLVDGENQDLHAEARIIKRESTPDVAAVQIDLSKAYPAKLKRWIRRIGLANRQAVFIQDTVESDQAVDILWGMVTGADISVDGRTAELTRNGWSVSAEIRTPRHAVFDIVSTASPSTQTPNTGTQKLVVRVAEKVSNLELAVVLTPHRTGQPKPVIKFPV